MSLRRLALADLVVAVREIKRVTGCLELVVGGSGALVVSEERADELLRTVDFDISRVPFSFLAPKYLESLQKACTMISAPPQ